MHTVFRSLLGLTASGVEGGHPAPYSLLAELKTSREIWKTHVEEGGSIQEKYQSLNQAQTVTNCPSQLYKWNLHEQVYFLWLWTLFL